MLAPQDRQPRCWHVGFDLAHGLDRSDRVLGRSQRYKGNVHILRDRGGERGVRRRRHFVSFRLPISRLELPLQDGRSCTIIKI